MREMKKTDIDWIPSMPVDWEELPNKYLMRKKKVINPVYHGEDILSLTMDGVIVRDLDAGGKMPTSFDGYQKVEAGNLLMCLFDYDVTPRCIGLIKQDGVTSPAYSQYVLFDNADQNYYYYYYLMVDNTKELLHLAKNLRHSFSEDDFGQIKAPHPPLLEQKRIASFLDSKCSEIDSLSATIQSEIDKLEEYKRSVITEAVTKGLDKNAEMKESGIEWIGNIPQSWQVIRGKYLFAQRNDRGNKICEQLLSPTQNYGVIPQDMYEKLSGFRAVKLNEKVNYGNLKTIHKGDYCISLRSFQGGFEYSRYEGVVSPAYQVFYPTVEIDDDYYRYLFKEQSFISKMNSYTMSLRDGKNIAFDDFGRTYIPVPPVSEQRQISSYLNKLIDKTDTIISQKKKQLETLDNYKKSLIYEYVTGKKEVPVA